VDRSEWLMSPPTVNAYYYPPNTEIVFPAGILQPPFFDKRVDDATNFGAIGGVIGHEFTHGFDDSGRKYDAKGNLTDWWTPADGKAFEERASCIADQYSSYTVIDDVKMNGRIGLGENTADNGGLRVAYMALMDTIAKNPELKKTMEGFTPEQRFFLGWAQIWCENSTPEGLRLRAKTGPHSVAKYRANGPTSNMPEFQEAFSCKAGQPMVRENRCRVW
jgi:putative endopeptidase